MIFEDFVHVYFRLASGRLEREPSLNFAPADYGGTIPAVGDLIVDPAVHRELARDDPRGRNILEVTARYFIPDENQPRVALVVRERPGNDAEFDLLGR